MVFPDKQNRFRSKDINLNCVYRKLKIKTKHFVHNERKSFLLNTYERNFNTKIENEARIIV
jgi:hypothetical protein